MGTENNPNELNKNCLAFGMQLFQAIQGIAGSTNIIISPVSIHLGLGLIYIGAAGKTAEEIKDVARLFEDKKETANAFLHVMCKYWNSENIHIANKLYVQEGNTLKSEVQRIAQHSFKCDIENLDFGEPENAAKACNKWVADKTNQKVKEVLTPNAIDPLTKAVLINVVYFKCDWKYPFKRTPQKADFWINETESVKVEMMIDNADEFHYGDFPELDCTAVELPFTNENFAMFFLLPKKKNGIETLESNWDKFDLVGCRKRMEKARVAVNLPKFRVDFSQKLNEPLIKVCIDAILFPIHTQKEMHNQFVVAV